MKSSFVLAAIATLAPVAVFAADLPVRSAAPVPSYTVPVFSWSGFYIGAHAGYTAIKPQYTEADPIFNTNPKLDGFVFGPYAGYNFQSGSIVYGLEADASFGSVERNAGRNLLPNFVGNNYSAFEQKWAGNVRARIGYSFGSVLAYVAGGVAFAKFSVDDVDVGYGSASKTHVGWTIGAGVDFALAPNWIARAEYLYSDYGRGSYTISAARAADIYTGSIKPQAHTIRVGLAYKFGGLAAPVVARY